MGGAGLLKNGFGGAGQQRFGDGRQRFGDGRQRQALRLILQAAVIHHVVHGALHLQEHALLLPLRDATEADSWRHRCYESAKL